MPRIIKINERDLNNIVHHIIREQYNYMTTSTPPTPFSDTRNNSREIESKIPKNTNCIPDVYKPESWSNLYNELVNSKKINKGEKILIVWGPTQTLYYTSDGNTTIKSFKVSTGANGFSNESENKQTPKGLLKIRKKIKAKPYEVLVSKIPTGKILGPNQDSSRTDEKGQKHVAEVLTGIMELDGLETCNKNAFSRNIYFHGTNREKYLGTPRSNGCVRVSNDAIEWMIRNVPENTKVYIQP